MQLPRLFRLPADLSAQERSNTLHYFGDISWWGLYVGATVSFLPIYAARIGATPAQIGLLTALPALIVLVFSLPFSGMVRRMGAHKATWVGALLWRMLLLGYALLPFFAPQSVQVWAILAIAGVLAVPSTLVGIGFPQLMIEALQADWRGVVVGTRNAIFSIISFAVTVLCGQILTNMRFPGGYQVVFFIGFAGAVMTAFHLYHVHPLARSSDAGAPLTAPGLGLLARAGLVLPTVDAEGRRYMRVIGLLFLFNTANSMVAPLVPAVLVNGLRLSDSWISIGVAVGALLNFIVSLFITRLTRRTGNRPATALGAVLMAAQALLLAVAADPGHYMLSVLVGGLGQGILLSAQFNYHLENVPTRDRPNWLSWNLMLGNGAILLGSLLGPLFSGLTGITTALAIFSVLRLMMGLVILKFG